MLHIYPAQGKETYIFREDDGISFDFETKGSCHTTITCSTDKHGHVIVEIGAREGDYNGKGKRKWIVVPHGSQADWQIRCAEEDTVELRALSEMGNGWQ